MFVARAHSFEQQARLAITLAWVAGYTNVITLVTCGVATSHVTGSVSNLGRDIVQGAWVPALYLLFLLVMFFLGAGVSSFLTEAGRRKGWDSIYVLPMTVETLLLAGFAVGNEFSRPSTDPSTLATWVLTAVASAAMGLQNATITRISSGVVRTTHLTGVLTDLGAECAIFVFWLRDQLRSPVTPGRGALLSLIISHPLPRRLVMLASVLGSFLLGALLGTLVVDEMPKWAMFPPVAFLLWIIYQDIATPICEIAGSDARAETTSMELPPGIAVFHLRKSPSRQKLAHKLPDLERWCDRLPAVTRVVILDLSAADLDADAAAELRQLMLQTKSKGRSVILCGISGAQYNQMRREGAGDALDISNVCPDVELAIARGFTLLERARR
ncbi:MAG: YoaK family protein [Phycisphaerales bacterium]